MWRESNREPKKVCSSSPPHQRRAQKRRQEYTAISTFKRGSSPCIYPRVRHRGTCPDFSSFSISRRASAPPSSSCLSSAGPSRVSLGSFDGAMEGVCDAAALAGGNSSSRDLRVRVRVPVAAKEELPLPSMTTTLGEGSHRAPDIEAQQYRDVRHTRSTTLIPRVQA